MVALFWVSAAIVGYVYFGYPLLLGVWTPMCSKRRTLDTPTPQRSLLPPVSIVIAARNEAARLPARIHNLLSLDYSGERQIVVVSDGSSDATEAVLEQFRDRVEVVAIPPLGKAGALNAGVARARHDILVFGDARQTFAPDALQWLTAPFADPTIGGVTGELVLGCEPGGRRLGQDRRGSPGSGKTASLSQTASERRMRERRSHLASSVSDGVGLYWRYEKRLRRLESAVGSTLGATGAIYALRRELWQPLPIGTILDDVLVPMRAVLAGARVVFEPRATAFDWAPPDSAVEAKRKTRTLAGNIQILALEPRLLLPVANPVWLQYLSHKVGRLVVPYALIGLMTASLALAERHWFYLAVLVLQCAFYALAGYGAWLEFRQMRREAAADVVTREAVLDA